MPLDGVNLNHSTDWGRLYEYFQKSYWNEVALFRDFESKKIVGSKVTKMGFMLASFGQQSTMGLSIRCWENGVYNTQQNGPEIDYNGA